MNEGIPVLMLDAALAILVLAALIALARLVLGPSVADRAAASDVCFFSLIAAVVVLAVRLDAPAFLDGIVVATLLGFLATVAVARLLPREDDP